MYVCVLLRHDIKQTRHKPVHETNTKELTMQHALRQTDYFHIQFSPAATMSAYKKQPNKTQTRLELSVSKLSCKAVVD